MDTKSCLSVPALRIRRRAPAAAPDDSTTSRPCSYVDRPASPLSVALGFIAIILPLGVTPSARAGVRGAVGDLYTCSVRTGNILQFDGMTGDFVCIFAERPAELTVFDWRPFDLGWASDGHLWVSSVGVFDGVDSVAKFDGQTGAFLGFIVAPAIQSPPGPSLSFGGQNGNLFVAEGEASWDGQMHEYDRMTSAYLGPVASPSPPMLSPQYAQFMSNGMYWILGAATITPRPTLTEYDPDLSP